MEQTKLTLGRTAKEAGVSKQTLSRWIKDGKVSQAEKQSNGSYLIDASELDRIRDLVKASKARNSNGDPEMELSITPSENNALQLRIKELEQETAFQQKLLNDRDGIIQDLRQERDSWRKSAESHQRLLTSGENDRDKKDDELRAMIVELRNQVEGLSQKKQGWFQRLFSNTSHPPPKREAS